MHPMRWSPVFGLLVAVLCLGVSVAQSAPPAASVLTGTVRSSDGKPLEGVPVSAKEVGSHVTTSVYTNRSGQYFFPPLAPGKYAMWAQAVGFEFTRVEQTISADSKVQQDFALKPFKDIW